MNSIGTLSRRYLFTPALHTQLRLAYSLTKRARADAITLIQLKTGWPRHIFSREAQRLNIVTSRRPWTQDEDRVLELGLGSTSDREIVRRLRRSHVSIKARVEWLRMSAHMRSGNDHGIADLSRVLGAPRWQINEWIEQGLLVGGSPTSDGDTRVKDESVRTFVRQNPALIDFRLADQLFIKDVLCGYERAYSSKGNNQ